MTILLFQDFFLNEFYCFEYFNDYLEEKTRIFFSLEKATVY